MKSLAWEAAVRKAETVLSDSWRTVYAEEEAELKEMFEKFGDRAYGVWIQRFMEPVCAFLNGEGFMVKGGFNLADSIENWGPPEERERCAWYVVRDGNGAPLGSMALQVYHSHKAFRIPRAPRLFALHETEREAIVAALSQASVRVRWDRPAESLPTDGCHGTEPRWEYAAETSLGDCLHPAEDGQVNAWALDEALAGWGRNGWELVSVAPASGKVVAFFKRPRPAG